MTASVDRIQGLSSALAIKTPVACATTTNILLYGLQTVDSLPLVAGDRVLVKNQIDATKNGIYEANTSDWQRTLDFNKQNDATRGTLVNVVSGNTNFGLWVLSTISPVIGTSALVFARPIGYTGAEYINYLPGGTGALPQSVQDALRGVMYVFDFLTDAEKAAVEARTFTLGVKTAVQNAINAAFAQQKKLIANAGGYLIDGDLFLPGRVIPGVQEDRGRSLIIEGAGCGEATVTVTSQFGTVFRRTSDGPVLQDYLDTEPSSNGTSDISKIRFEANSSGPGISLKSMSGLSKFHDCQLLQNGAGDGFYIGWSALASFENIFTLNKDWATYGVNGARTGVGFRHVTGWDSGLVSFKKCSARGYHTGFVITGETGKKAISTTIEDCQTSVTYNGIQIINANKAKVRGNYMEGLEGGTAILDQGDYSVIKDNFISSGALVGVDASDSTALGTVIEGNFVNLGAVANAIGITVDFGSNAPKTVQGNYIASTAATAGAIGIQMKGTAPALDIAGNFLIPYAAWTGAGAKRIDNQTTGTPYGRIQVESGARIIDQFYGAYGLSEYPTYLTQANVNGSGELVLPNGGFFEIEATSAVTVSKFLTDQKGARMVTFYLHNTNLTFDANTRIVASADFSGPGMITFLIRKPSSLDYAYEVSRITYP